MGYTTFSDTPNWCFIWFCWSLSLLNGYFIGNIPNIFRHTQLMFHMVLLIIIPIKWLFHWEYTQHFQTHPIDVSSIEDFVKPWRIMPLFWVLSCIHGLSLELIRAPQVVEGSLQLRFSESGKLSPANVVPTVVPHWCAFVPYCFF